MEFAGEQSWHISEDDGWDLTVALFVRDVAGLRDPGDATTPPALSPPVDVDRDLHASIDAAAAASAWRSWWSALVQDRATAVPGDDPRVRLRQTAPGARLGDRLEPAFAWADERKADQMERFARRSHDDRLIMSRIVAAAVEPLGRAPRPFRLTVTTLPTAGLWSQRVAGSAVLVSEPLRQDAGALEGLLRPIVAELAGAA